MVISLDSGSSGSGSASPGRGHCLCSWVRHFLSIQVYKWGTGEFNAGGNPAMD